MLKVWPARPPSTRAGARVDGREMGLLVTEDLLPSLTADERPA
jgi:hypothetical protein